MTPRILIAWETYGIAPRTYVRQAVDARLSAAVIKS